MVKVFALARGNTFMDSRRFKSRIDAEKEARSSNKQFKEFNDFIKERKIIRKPIKFVKVKEVSFSRKKNIF